MRNIFIIEREEIKKWKYEKEDNIWGIEILNFNLIKNRIFKRRNEDKWNKISGLLLKKMLVIRIEI